MPSVQSDFANELALRPAIAFTKRVSGINLAGIMGGAFSKHSIFILLKDVRRTILGDRIQ